MSFLKDIINDLKLIRKKLPEEAKLEIPFFSKDEEYERKFLGFLFDDKHMTNWEWRWIGLKNKREYLHLMDASCGMVCLKSILMKIENKEHSVIKLMQESKNYGTYNFEELDKGMFYEPFVLFIKDKFNLDSRIYQYLSLKRLKYELSLGNFIIASVHPYISRPVINDKNTLKGGHLILITAYSDKYKTISIHNSDGILNLSDKNFTISYKMFFKYFAKRGIIVSSK
ncbi:MAG: hypothetical protein Q9M91_06585 [Candidatus Dojkabacteria bacterium]|nr:hypothetical protein [Candidatus Dojkabacteria bacterium]MDQ7021463.1 hypothetical protein [Candidatus Dojkabacteria bacterium]